MPDSSVCEWRSIKMTLNYHSVMEQAFWLVIAAKPPGDSFKGPSNSDSDQHSQLQDLQVEPSSVQLWLSGYVVSKCMLYN